MCACVHMCIHVCVRVCVCKEEENLYSNFQFLPYCIIVPVERRSPTTIGELLPTF